MHTIPGDSSADPANPPSPSDTTRMGGDLEDDKVQCKDNPNGHRRSQLRSHTGTWFSPEYMEKTPLWPSQCSMCEKGFTNKAKKYVRDDQCKVGGTEKNGVWACECATVNYLPCKMCLCVPCCKGIPGQCSGTIEGLIKAKKNGDNVEELLHSAAPVVVGGKTIPPSPSRFEKRRSHKVPTRCLNKL